VDIGNLASADRDRHVGGLDPASPYRLSLARFVAAQSGVYDLALAELKAGQKRTHWMWFVLPQLRGLGFSMMADRYGLEDRGEALAYLQHPVLGARLRECVAALLPHVGQRSAGEIMGVVDAIKLHSCLTLFDAVGGGELFTRALDGFYRGERDRRTLAMLEL